MSADPTLLAYYARRAREYDRIYEKPERQADLAALRLRVREYFAGTAVYEVACGTGYWTAELAAVAAAVYATDRNEEVLTLAGARLAGRDGVAWAEADAFAPPPAPFAISAGFAGFWWSHLRTDELGCFLEAFFRRLGTGARFAFLDNAFVEGSSTPITRSDEGGNTYQTRRLADGTEHEVLKNFPTETQVRQALAPWAVDVRWRGYPYYWWAEGRVR
jgi:demethylmenaquinone methyltransferase/2-methoxy-6-polyprenyl-1,4-benzoquinol methylase